MIVGKDDYESKKETLLKKAFELGFNYEYTYGGCSQCTLAAIQDTLGIKDNNVIKAASAFWGGIGLTTDGPCGAFSAGVLAIGQKFGRPRHFQSSGIQAHRLAKKLSEKWREEYGSYICKNILKKICGRSYDMWDEEEVKQYAEDGGDIDKCTNVVGNGAKWAVEIILEEERRDKMENQNKYLKKGLLNMYRKIKYSIGRNNRALEIRGELV